MRLIDADRLKNALIGLMDTSSPVPSDNDCAIDGMLNLLNDQPDVDTVKHGHWMDDGYLIGYLRCSHCYRSLCWNRAKRPKFCPNCGCKMDGDKSETD